MAYATLSELKNRLGHDSATNPDLDTRLLAALDAATTTIDNDTGRSFASTTATRTFGEDMSFCVRLAEFEIPVFMHTGVKTTHMKTIWLSESHFDALPTYPTVAPNRAQRRAAAKSKE